jgi:integrase
MALSRTLASATSTTVQKRVAGKVKRITLPKGITKTEAVKEARALTVGIDTKTVEIGNRRLTLQALVDDFLAFERSPQGSRKASTVDLYEGHLARKVIPFLGPQTRVEDLTTQHVRRLIGSMKLQTPTPSGSSMRGAACALSAVLTHGVINLGTSRNVARGLLRGELPSNERTTEPRYLDAEQVEALLAAMSATYRPVATACYWGALRVSEALALRWSDVRGNDLLVRGTKTKGSTATIPLLPPLKAALDAHRKARMALGLHLVSDDALVFGTAEGGPLSRRNVLRSVNDASDTAGLNPEGAERVGCHDLRHSAASRALVDLGLSLPEVATFLRHSNSNVTGSTYAGISDAAREGIREKLAVGL